jgi:hypothetical protein
LYTREADYLASRFAADANARQQARARWLRVARLRRDHLHIAARALHRLRVWPWYEHPRVIFDFERRRWLAR